MSTYALPKPPQRLPNQTWVFVTEDRQDPHCPLEPVTHLINITGVLTDLLQLIII